MGVSRSVIRALGSLTYVVARLSPDSVKIYTKEQMLLRDTPNKMK